MLRNGRPVFVAPNNNQARQQVWPLRRRWFGCHKCFTPQGKNNKKALCATFKEVGLKITVEASIEVINYLDISLKLTNGSYAPYNKPGNTPAYVHSKSNHPPTIIRNIPTTINKRLSNISSNARTFSKATAIYQQALRNSEYEHSLQYTRTNSIDSHTAMKRKRNITHRQTIP